MSDPVDRRDFLKTTTVAGSALALSAAHTDEMIDDLIHVLADVLPEAVSDAT